MKNILSLFKTGIKIISATKEERRHALVGPADLWKMKRNFQIHFLKKMNLKSNSYLLDIGCGTLRGGLPLIQYLLPGHYFGVEVRENVLNEGKKELKEAGMEGKKPQLLLSSDISKLEIKQKFHFIWAFSVLIHMSDDTLNDTLGFIRRHLSDDGIFYTNINTGNPKNLKWQGFPLVWRPFEFYRDICLKNDLSVTDIGSLKDNGHISNIKEQDEQRILKIIKR